MFLHFLLCIFSPILVQKCISQFLNPYNVGPKNILTSIILYCLILFVCMYCYNIYVYIYIYIYIVNDLSYCRFFKVSAISSCPVGPLRQRTADNSAAAMAAVPCTGPAATGGWTWPGSCCRAWELLSSGRRMAPHR